MVSQAMQHMAVLWVVWFTTLVQLSHAALDANRAAEISRNIRQHYRDSGMNWVSLKMLHDVVDLQTNTKPIMYLFINYQSCPSCQQLMQQFIDMDHSTLSQLSAQFLAVLVMDESLETFGQEFAPFVDGPVKVPIAIFADPTNKLRPEVQNPKPNGISPYMYGSALEVVAQMHAVLRHHQSQPLSLARQGLRTPGSTQQAPVSSLQGGSGQFRGDLEFDL